MFGNYEINVTEKLRYYFDFVLNGSEYQIHKAKFYRVCNIARNYIKYDIDNKKGIFIYSIVF